MLTRPQYCQSNSCRCTQPRARGLSASRRGGGTVPTVGQHLRRNSLLRQACRLVEGIPCPSHYFTAILTAGTHSICLASPSSPASPASPATSELYSRCVRCSAPHTFPNGHCLMYTCSSSSSSSSSKCRPVCLLLLTLLLLLSHVGSQPRDHVQIVCRELLFAHIEISPRWSNREGQSWAGMMKSLEAGQAQLVQRQHGQDLAADGGGSAADRYR